MNDLIVRSPTEMAPSSAPSGATDGVFVPNRPQRAAIVLSLIEPQDAAILLKEFGEETLMNFAKAVSELKPVPPHVVEEVALEFLAALGNITDVRGGVEQVREFLSAFMEEEEVNRIVSELADKDVRPVWERFIEAPLAAASGFLALEHPQTVAVILSKLRPDVSAKLLESLEVDFAQTTIARMSKAPRPITGVLKDIEVVIEDDFLSVISRQSAATKPAELIGNLMNNVSGTARDGFLKFLEDDDAVFAQEVQREMFTFADIVDRVPPVAVAMIVKDVEEETLMMALKFAQDSNNPSYDFFIGNLSKRLAERLVEDMDAMEDVKEKDGEAAQMEIISAIQRKAKLGEIKLIEVDPE